MEITLIFPHQLFRDHPGLGPGRCVVLVEHPLFFGNDATYPLAAHKQRLVLHRASMQAYAAEMRATGHQVSILENRGGALAPEPRLPAHTTVIHAADPADDILSRRLHRHARRLGAELVLHPSPNFLSPPDFLERHTGGAKKPFMATFYQAQRRRLGILVEDDGSPSGGQWSFDVENRARLPKNHPVPAEPRSLPDAHTTAAIAHIERLFPNNPGRTEDFRWPVTRVAAETWLDGFLTRRFADFGAYEDAISIAHPFLHHSAITPALNIGLLDPREVVDRALAIAARSGEIPLNSLEGFIRQIIGWREFMHGIYRHRGVAIRNSNFWNFDRPMPAAFYDATTGIPPVDRVIRQLLREGYCHHIERLMVLGNFMLLCRIHPEHVWKWFMELFVDAYDWVMVPNVFGMSQFADGGTFTTKPYLSGSNYILKMSDEPKGPWCAVWDSLFWTFIADHQDFFLANPRLSMMARTWAKLSAEKQTAHRETAGRFLAGLHGTATWPP